MYLIWKVPHPVMRLSVADLLLWCANIRGSK